MEMFISNEQTNKEATETNKQKQLEMDQKPKYNS